ncbi:MAG TPA: hypothetical protein VFD84_20935 [Candidatus Binatia bacterium]|nr:hypothetical protein [Candidatus Binatia bacterium]
MRARSLAAVAAFLALGAAPCPAFAACGDGRLDSGERCDDGNTRAGDCCSPTCAYEQFGSPCDDLSVCTTADACDGIGVCRGVKISCEDGDRCTIDRCAPTDGCHHDPVDFASTLGQVAGTLATEACEGEDVPAGLRKRFTRAGTLVMRAERAASRAKRRRLVKRAASELRTANGAAHRAKRHVSADCAKQLERRVTTARARTMCLLASLRP